MDELALHLIDIMQNSITADSSLITVGIKLDDGDMLDLSVTDDGCGMDEETLKCALDPFYTSRKTRKIGLGLSMFREAALTTGGDFTISSKVGEGTSLCASFVNGSIDRQPLGNVGNIFFMNMIGTDGIDFRLELAAGDMEYTFDSAEAVRAAEAEGGSLMDAAFDAEDTINDKVKEIFQGKLPEIEGR